MTDASGSQKIVVGVDGSASSITALQWAVRHAQLTGSVVQAVTAWQDPHGVVPAVPEDLDFEAESRRALDSAIARAFSGGAPVQVTRVVEDGEPGPILVRTSMHAALLVVGSRGH